MLYIISCEASILLKQQILYIYYSAIILKTYFALFILQAGSCGLVIIKETPLICPILGIVLSNNGKPDNTADNEQTKTPDTSTQTGITTVGMY